jgi:hypothetical protein
VRCTLFGVDTGNVKHFPGSAAFQMDERRSYYHNEDGRETGIIDGDTAGGVT